MAVLILLLLVIPVALYTIASATPLVHRSIGITFSELIAGRVVAAHSLVLGIALLTFAAASASLFIVRNNTLMIGSKKTLLVIGAFALLCSMVLGVQLFKAARPILLDLERPAAIMQRAF